jgi:large subunit ribosomal protein L5
MPIAAMVTLRGERMSSSTADEHRPAARPQFRVSHPRGSVAALPLGCATGCCLEIDAMKVDKARGMNVSVVTTAKTDEEARKLLQLIGMPFRAA